MNWRMFIISVVGSAAIIGGMYAAMLALLT